MPKVSMFRGSVLTRSLLGKSIRPENKAPWSRRLATAPTNADAAQ